MTDLVLNLKKDKSRIEMICEALSNINRLKILEVVSNKSIDDLSHKKIAEELGITTSAVSYHLKPLVLLRILREDKERSIEGKHLKKVPKLEYKKIVIEL